MKEKLLTIVGLIGSAISYVFGGWSDAMNTLLFFMIADIVTGWILSAFLKGSPKTETGGLSSKIGFRGLCKKCFILLWVLIAYRLDITLGTVYIKYGVIYAFMVNELLSLVENSTLLGFPTPQIISDAIDILKSKGYNKGTQ
jgi:toxin secretion/phage lysis holin